MDGGWQSGSEPMDGWEGERGKGKDFGWWINGGPGAGSWGTEEGEGGSAVQVGAPFQWLIPQWDKGDGP
jgi:hypothetical protein